MLFGRFANDPIYTKENSNGIAPVARRCFNEGTINEMIDPRLMEEAHENIYSVIKGVNQDSLDAFVKIAYQCVAETQVERPTAEVIAKKLEEVLSFQENPNDRLKISFPVIKSATQNFSKDCLINKRGQGNVYKGEITNVNGFNIMTAMKVSRKTVHGGLRFIMELQILLEYEHKNIIGLVGYCEEMDKRIIVYEYASRGSLDKHLTDNNLTWIKRLEICIDIASGLDFLHGGAVTQEVVIHKNIKSRNILLTDDWTAKITDFRISLKSPINNDMDVIMDHACSAPDSYRDPLYEDMNFLTKESDIYSIGVVLLEILCGRLVNEYPYDKHHKHRQPLTALFKRHYKKGTLTEMVFEGIKEQILPKSLSTFQMIVYQCLHRERERRPTISEVLLQLKKALEFQMENTFDNTMDSANKRVIAPKTNELVPPLAHNVFVSVNSHADQPEKFNGSNFKGWQQKMLFYLTTLNLARFLTDDAPEFDAQVGDIVALGVIDAWKHSDFLCRNYLLNSLVEALSNKFSTATTAKELWESLEREYNTHDVVVARFLEYKMEESKSIVEQVQQLQTIMQDIHAKGIPMSDKFQVDVIIEKLPPAWVDFKKYLKHKPKEMSVEDLIAQLQIQEDNKLAEKRGYVSDLAKANVFEPDQLSRANM